MSKLKTIILLSGICALIIAIGLITLISFMNYQSYRSQFKTNEAEAVLVIEDK